MAVVKISELSKHYGAKLAVTAIDRISLDIPQGEMLVLLGPSGCGKTTILRCLAGLEAPDHGTIALGEQVVVDVAHGVWCAPEQRGVGMVFQNYALWPHLTVRQNIAFPLEARGATDGLKGGWVEETAALVECEGLLDRYPAQLSGGQQQRVALARGLVARPSLVLFDEPLSNLDARLRSDLRVELSELHKRLGFTGIYVTHDQVEAMTIGDRVAVMRAGHLEQLGAPREVYERPRTEYVAEFLGAGTRVAVERRDGALSIDGVALTGNGSRRPGPDGPYGLRLRPERVLLLPPGSRPAHQMYVDGGVVSRVTFSGRFTDYAVQVNGVTIEAQTGSTQLADQWTVGSPVTIAFSPDDVLLYDAAGLLDPNAASAPQPVTA